MSAKSGFVQLCDFTHVRRFLTHDACILVANALVSSWLDTVTHFSGVSLSLIFINCSASKTV